MRNWKMIVASAVVVLVLVGAGSLYAQQKKTPKLTTDDYSEITRIYYRYSWSVDSRDGKTWASLFTPDGVFEYPNGNKVVGHDALMLEPQKALGDPTATTAVHMTTNIWTEATPEGAHGGAYLLNVVPGGQGKPATITAVSFYEDWFVKTQDGWRIKHRLAHSEGGRAPSVITGTASK
jgi:hypothetical protein